MRHLQKHGKYFADVSYWGPLNVRSKQPAPVTEAALEYIIASWLLGNEGLSSVFVRSMRGFTYLRACAVAEKH